MKNFKYVNLTKENNYDIIGIAYKKDNNENSHLSEIVTIFKHDNYYSLAHNYLTIPKTYTQKEIINFVINNINAGVFESEGVSVSGSLENINQEFFNLTRIKSILN